MSNLTYLTRGNANPQGKPRVYFCCHPDDRELFFDSISSLILKYHNCAIWYNADPNEPHDREERELNLSQMQLFVIPITYKLLARSSDAMDWEIPFAIRNHIPVLPIIEEEGLEKMFAEKFGDIQYLDPNVKDVTAIPYEEKLKKYLDSVLVGDELAAQVRAAFDAYIFLSYRKKDRSQAQQLMRLIHENDFCRDIAIWYDEFLTPGDNFNSAIAEALKKSELFTLVVTPNLLEKPNYVMTDEYPMAKKASKDIFPVEMTKTGRKELEECYTGIPSCTKAQDSAALSKELLKHLQEVAVRENDEDPQHNYFIGIAYLSGIDVEVNHEKAVELIKGSAEKEYEPAIEKLVNMYRTGEGVERDYREAISWQKKLVEHREKIWNEEQSEEASDELFSALWDLGDYYEELQDLKNWRKSWEKALTLCEQVRKKHHFSKVSRNISVSYNELGDISKAEGKISEGRKYYELSLEISKSLAEESPTIENRRDLSVSYERLENISKAEGNLSEARRYYELVLNISKSLAEESPTIENRRGLSASYNRLGDISQAEGNISEARRYYELSLEIFKSLAEESPTIENRRGLSVSYERLGNISKAEENISEARRYYEPALEISESLAEESLTIENRRDLSVSYERLGDISEAEGNLFEARRYYELSLEIFKSLAEESPTIENRRGLSISYEKLGNISKAEGNISEARRYYEPALETSKSLAEESPTIENRRDLSVSYEKLGDIGKAEGNISEARRYYELSLEIRKSLTEESPTIENRRDLSVSYNKLGNISQAEGNISEARRYYELDLEISKSLAEESPTIENRRDLSVSYNRLGDISEAEEARRYYELGLEISKSLVEETDAPQAWDDVAASLCVLGMLDGISVPHLQEALEIWTDLVEKYPENISYVQKMDLIKELLNENK